MSKKSAYMFMAMSESSSLKEEVESAYVEAFQKGYSVVELARAVGVKSAQYIHAVLVKRGEIPRGKPGKQKRGVIPGGMHPYLLNRSITYAQWCAGWNFEQHAVFDEVSTLSGPSLAAIRRDFPGYYLRLTGVKAETFARGEVFVASKPEILLRWDENQGVFCAVIKEMGIECYEASYINALKSALSFMRSKITIKRLRALPGIGKTQAIW